MVARTVRDDSLGQLLFIQLVQCIGGSSDFERARFLEVFTFEEDVKSAALIECLTGCYGRLMDTPGQSLRSVYYVLVGWRGETCWVSHFEIGGLRVVARISETR